MNRKRAGGASRLVGEREEARMRKVQLTGKDAVWRGMRATPFLLIAVLITIGVAAANARAAKTTAKTAAAAAGNAPAYLNPAQNGGSVAAYWTKARMASASPVGGIA